METPFYDQICRLAGAEGIKARFFVPGHKGKAPCLGTPPKNGPEYCAFSGNLWPFDLTEIAGADNLMLPKKELKKSQENMAKIYGSGATLYSASGSTSCIQAMLSLFCGPGGQVVMARNCHIAAVRALALLGAAPVWAMPGPGGQPQAEEVERLLAESGAKAVYVTSPDYYGNLCDIKSLAKLCGEYGAKLLVDNAHGAHLRFIPGPDGVCLHPLALGADACADSAHKTLPCLTPAALLHIKEKKYAEKARQMLNLYSSTSPSYLVLCSLDLAAGLLAEGRIPFLQAVKKVEKLGKLTKFGVEACADPLRIRLNAHQVGYTGARLEEYFIREKIPPEMADHQYIIFMAGPYNSQAEYAALENAIKTIEIKPKIKENKFILKPPRQKVPLREAFFADSHRLSVRQSPGRAYGGGLLPPLAGLPMGVPALLPGEEIGPEMAALLANSGIGQINVLK